MLSMLDADAKWSWAAGPMREPLETAQKKLAEAVAGNGFAQEVITAGVTEAKKGAASEHDFCTELKTMTAQLDPLIAAVAHEIAKLVRQQKARQD